MLLNMWLLIVFQLKKCIVIPVNTFSFTSFLLKTRSKMITFTFMAVITDAPCSSLSPSTDSWELELNVIVSKIVDIGNREPQQIVSALVG